MVKQSKSRITQVLNVSKKDFNRYKKTKKIIYLQQAGNKLYKTLLMITSYINQEKILTNSKAKLSIKQLIDKGVYDSDQVENIFNGHARFYNEGDEYFMIKQYNRGYIYLKNFIRRLR